MESQEKNNKTGFRVPQNFFEESKKDILTLIKDPIKFKDTGFTVPHNYFDVSNKKILEKVNSRKNTSIKYLTKKKVISVMVPIAASFLIYFSLFYHPAIDFNDLSTSEIENYISENVHQFNDSEILLNFNETELEELENDIQNLENNSVLIYLNENLEDTTLLNF